MTRSYTHSRPYPAWNRVQLEAGVASGAALVNCRRTITALLECGDLSPLWPLCRNESGDKSPHSISDSLFYLSVFCAHPTAARLHFYIIGPPRRHEGAKNREVFGRLSSCDTWRTGSATVFSFFSELRRSLLSSTSWRRETFLT